VQYIEKVKRVKNSKNQSQFTGILCFVLVYATPGFLVTGAYTLMGRRLWAVRPPFDDQQGMISVQQVNQYNNIILWVVL